MKFTDSEILQMQAEKSAHGTCGPTYGACTSGLNDACRPSLQERVKSQLDRAYGEARRASRLNELATLLQNNPDVARILDLIEDVRQ